MTRTSGNPRARVEDWKADLLRLTTFHQPALLTGLQGSWNRLTGDQPESTINKPAIDEWAEIGRHEELPLVAQVNAREGRMDWIYGAPGQADTSPAIVSLTNRLPIFVDLMRRWLGTACPHTKRFAFGAILKLPVGNRDEAYRMLSNYLTFDLDPDTSSDFMYQINRKRHSGILPNILLNRVMKWSSEVYHERTLTFSPSGISAGDAGQPRYHCVLELDINTLGEVDMNVPGNALPDLLEETTQLSLEILREGDIP